MPTSAAAIPPLPPRRCSPRATRRSSTSGAHPAPRPPPVPLPPAISAPRPCIPRTPTTDCAHHHRLRSPSPPALAITACARHHRLRSRPRHPPPPEPPAPRPLKRKITFLPVNVYQLRERGGQVLPPPPPTRPPARPPSADAGGGGAAGQRGTDAAGQVRQAQRQRRSAITPPARKLTRKLTPPRHPPSRARASSRRLPPRPLRERI
jgi:hypothetical protein